jgi:hypothetical protein
MRRGKYITHECYSRSTPSLNTAGIHIHYTGHSLSEAWTSVLILNQSIRSEESNNNESNNTEETQDFLWNSFKRDF